MQKVKLSDAILLDVTPNTTEEWREYQKRKKGSAAVGAVIGGGLMSYVTMHPQWLGRFNEARAQDNTPPMPHLKAIVGYGAAGAGAGKWVGSNIGQIAANRKILKMREREQTPLIQPKPALKRLGP